MRKLRRLRLKHEALGRKHEEAKKDTARQLKHVYERMEKDGVESIKVDGVLFSPYEQVFGKVQDERKFVKWARQHDPDLLDEEPSVRAGELNSRVRALLDDGKPLPPGVGFYTKEVVSQRAGDS